MRARTVFLLLAAAAAVVVPPAGSTGGERPSFAIEVPAPPTPVPVDGGLRLVFEIHLSNFAAEPLRLRRLVLLDALTGRTFVEHDAAALEHRLGRTAPAAGAEALVVAPGARVVVYLEPAVAAGAAPQAILPRLEYARGEADETLQGSPIPVLADPPPALGPPLRGGPWIAVHHPSWPRGHRRVIYALGGCARIPGRFAIDWILVDESGRATRGDRDRVRDWLGYRAEVIAVADATVAAARDDVAESARLSTHPEHPLGDATGNYVALDLGDGRFAFYEHLAPGSVRVRAGQRVRRGDPLAALGFTGHSTGPHLHFHVADGRSPLGAEGVPFVLERFTLLGTYADGSAPGEGPWTPRLPAAGSTRRGELPPPNAVVRFEAGAR